VQLDNPSSVLMLSGGVDSVALLKKLLEETDEDIYAHHFHLKSFENTYFKKAEAKALRKIVPYMKKAFRDFHYTESTIDVRQIMNLISHDEKDLRFACIPEHIYYNLLGGVLAKITKSDKLYSGICKEDFKGMHFGGLEEYSFENREKFIMRPIINSTSYPYKILNNDTRFKNPLSKRQEIEYIGEELMKMVWYCRHPIRENNKFIPCNECRPCKDVNNALIEIEEEQRGIKYA